MVEEVSVERSIIVPSIIGLAIVVIIFQCTKSRLFAWGYTNLVSKDMMVYMAPIKKEFFSSLAQHKSYFEQLRKDNSIRILEIGPGPGTNFEYYPQNSRIICYDPNPHFAATLGDHQKKFRRVTLEQIITSGAENLCETETESVDVVVCTFVFCSVLSIQAVVKEVKRVLVPGGKFYFMEHVNSAEGTWRQLLKQIVEPLWKYAFINCHLTRNPIPLIRNYGFAKVETSNFVMPITQPVLKQFVNDSVLGIAQK